MRERTNIYPSQARDHYEDLLAAIGSKPADADQWVARRDARREARQSWRGRMRWRRLADA